MSDRKRSDRDRERKRRRSRSPTDRRSSPEHRRRNERNGESSRSRDEKPKVEPTASNEIANTQEQLEAEMRKRRERVEQWRIEKQKREHRLAEEAAKLEKEQKTNGASAEGVLEDDESDDSDMEIENTEAKSPKKDEDEVDPLEAFMADLDKSDKKPDEKKVEEQEDVDPLDAYMAELDKTKSKDAQAKKARVVELDTNKQEDDQQKGEIIENEDEAGPLVDDFDMEQAASSLMSKGRQLAQTNHEMVYYRPFRRNFYIEVPELQKMSKKEVEKYREELDEIKVRGLKCPKPIKNWAQAGVELKVLNTLKKLGYAKPTSIQAQTIPAILSGRDVIGIGKTGSGKTLAFLLPMFRHIRDQDPLDELDGPIAIVMSPTRELALQTYKEAVKFCRSLDIRVVCVYGGVGISDQIGDLKKGAEIVVCTPGRMIDMLAANNGKVTNLRRVTYLVMDEADRMFDMGFEPQVMKIINNIRPDRQTVLFSATFPKQMEGLARKILEHPVEIQVGGKSVVCKDIEQHAMIVEEHVKFLKLLELLGRYWEMGNVLVFVDKQEKADDVVSQLMHSGYNCAPLHGGIDQYDRDSTLADFKKGVLKLMVATSVAARGLDVKKLILVVNYDCPNHYEDYVHRVGRTGRAGNKGFAYTFVLPSSQEKLAGEVCRAFETAGVEAPAELKEMWVTYKEQMKAQGIDVHVGGGGFAGSGYKYDDNEDEHEANKKKFTKMVHGLEAGGDDDEDIEQQLNSMMKSKSRVVSRKANAAGASSSEGASVSTARPSKVEQQVQENKVAAARAAAEKIATDKKLNAQPVIEKDATSLTAEAVMKGQQAPSILLTPAAIAKQKAEQLNSKLNYLPSAINFSTQEEAQLEYFEEELEINDFPQQLRYRICSRESIAQIQEFADVGISVKGLYYPPGREPKEGMERKLYLFLEARDQMSLKRAREEILRIMKEALRQLTSTGSRQYAGRYSLF